MRRKWGTNRRPGIKTNAGKVILLKTPATSRKDKTTHAKIDEFCYGSRVSALFVAMNELCAFTYLDIDI